jgi:putative addiction module component (TIGR02574 family)
MNVKQRALELIEGLPENCSWDDVLYAVDVVMKIDEGLADSEAGRVVPIDKLRAVFGLDEPPDDPEEVEKAWEEEIHRRIEDLSSGRVQPIPYEVVRAEMRRIIEQAENGR